MRDISSLVDLDEYLHKLELFFARKKPFFIEGDINVHYQFIKELSNCDYKVSKKVKNLDSQLAHLQKFGVLKLYEIYEFVKIIDYFLYLKRFGFEGILFNWLEKIEIPSPILDIVEAFTKDGELKSDLSEEYASILNSIEQID